MSHAEELLSQLRTLGVQLRLEGETLRLNAPKGALTPELQSQLKGSKAEIVALLHSRQDSGGASSVISIPRVMRQPRMPISLAQQRLWFLQQIEPQSAAYNMVVFLRLAGNLQENVLERSLFDIVQRHEDLRTVFGQEEGTPFSRLIDGTQWQLERPSFELRNGERLEEAAFRFSEDRASDLFDLEVGPLFRAFLLPVADEEYLVVLAMHHIIADGWSIGVIVRELAENYQAYCLNQLPRLPDLPIQYFDYAEWQRTWLERGVLDRQMPYWRKQLEGAPGLSIFPPDHPRRNDGTARGKRCRFTLSAALRAQIESFSRGHDATLFMTLLSAFQLMLARYSGQRDVVVGSPVANRGRAELSDLVGFFVNNLVLRVQVDEGISFQELLNRVRETTLGAFEHQEMPFDQLVRELQTDRSVDYAPIFQTMFTLQNFPLEDLKLPGVTVSPLEVDGSIARFDLTFEVYPYRNELLVVIEYRADLYDEKTILQLQQSYAHILQSVVDAPSQSVDQVPLLPPSAREKLLWLGAIQSHAPTPSLLVEQLVRFSNETPDKVAVRAGIDGLTYAELNHRANALASTLIQAGAGRGSLVPVCLHRSTNLLTALLAVLKTGAAYVPLDPIYPAQRIASILEDVKPSVLISEPTLLPLLGGQRSHAILLDETWSGESTIDEFEPAFRDVESHADDLAYVIFTSGSTGRPKGVEITHGSLANFLESMRNSPGLNQSDRLLAVTTVSFDIAGLELFLPLYVGGEVVIALAPGDLPALLDDLERAAPTVMQATPALWQMLVSSGWNGNPNLTALCGGEALTPQLAHSLLPRVKELWNMYGPTETTIWSSALRIESVAGSGVPVGRPIRNTSFFVLDSQREPTPMGVAGELYIGGDGLARGYLNRPELTAERFVAAPFTGGERLYRTGDLVRSRRDGTLDFLGRADFQVKLRGFRIELGEIEHALRQQAEISECVVLLREHSGQKELVAYVVSQSGLSISLATLRQRLRERLPEYMVPSGAVFLPSLPRLPNGKLDRSKLPLPVNDDQGEGSGLDTDAQSETELAIASVFRELLHVDRIGVNQRFFDLGAHSLMLVKVHDRLRRTLDPELRLVSFFQYPSVASLADHIDESRKRAGEMAHAGE